MSSNWLRFGVFVRLGDLWALPRVSDQYKKPTTWQWRYLRSCVTPNTTKRSHALGVQSSKPRDHVRGARFKLLLVKHCSRKTTTRRTKCVGAIVSSRSRNIPYRTLNTVGVSWLYSLLASICANLTVSCVMNTYTEPCI